MIHNTKQRLDWSNKDKKKFEWLHAQLQNHQQGKHCPLTAQDPPWYCRKKRRRGKEGNMSRWMWQWHHRKKGQRRKGETRVDKHNNGWFIKFLEGKGMKSSVIATNIVVYGVSDKNKHHGLRQSVRGLQTVSVNQDNFIYQKAYTYSILHEHKATNNIDDLRHKVSPPKEGILFDIQRSGEFSRLTPAQRSEAEIIHLNSGYYIQVPKDLTLGRP